MLPAADVLDSINARLYGFCDTFRNEYWKVHENFEEHGFSLHPHDISKRATTAAKWAVVFLSLITLPIILYYRGTFKPSLVYEMSLVLAFAGLLFYILIVIAQLMWITTFIAGRKVGGSKTFLNFVGTRWGKRIDEITSAILESNKTTTLNFGACVETDGIDLNTINPKQYDTSETD